MNRQRFLLVATFVALLFGAVVVVAQGGTKAAEDPQANQPQLIRRSEIPPTPTPPALPAPAAVSGKALLQDSFDTADSEQSWTAVDLVELGPVKEPARWGVRDGALWQLFSGDHYAMRPDGTLAVTGSADWTDYTLQAQVYPEFNSEIGLVVRRQGDSFYRLRIFPDALKVTPKIRLEKVEDGKVTLLASQDAPGFQAYRWYTLKVTAQGSRIIAQIDDGEPLVAEDAALAQGQAGLYSLALGYVRFDNVTVVAP